MEVQEAVDKKRAAEIAIHHLLKELETSTGLQVQEVRLIRSGIVRGFAPSPLRTVELVCVV